MDICIYCDICYCGNVSGSSKNVCLNCLENIVDNSLYKDINILLDYKIKYDKNKIICETCNQSHNLFITSPLCSKHKGRFEQFDYNQSDHSYPEDFYDYQENDKYFGEIKEEIIRILKYSKLTYKVFQMKDENFYFNHSRYIFIYINNCIACKFIYDDNRLILIFSDKIYTTSNFYDAFREMYFGKLSCKLLGIGEILEVFKNNFKIKCGQIKNFDEYIKPKDLVLALIDRFEILNDPLIDIQSDWWCKCHNCESYNYAIRFIYNSNEILRVVYHDLYLSVWNLNKVYTNNKDQCLHLNSCFEEESRYLNVQDDIYRSNFKYLNFNTEYNIEYKSYIEIYKLVINYPNVFKEKKTWSDITKYNI